MPTFKLKTGCTIPTSNPRQLMKLEAGLYTTADPRSIEALRADRGVVELVAEDAPVPQPPPQAEAPKPEEKITHAKKK